MSHRSCSLFPRSHLIFVSFRVLQNLSNGGFRFEDTGHTSSSAVAPSDSAPRYNYQDSPGTVVATLRYSQRLPSNICLVSPPPTPPPRCCCSPPSRPLLSIIPSPGRVFPSPACAVGDYVFLQIGYTIYQPFVQVSGPWTITGPQSTPSQLG